jgi:hypothetical protein
LFEADFNHNNKRIGKTLMDHAEANNWIAKEQYGSRKNVSAIDHCINKRLSFDVIRQFKHPAALCVNDMKGCYDRIVHSVAAICMQRMGTDKQVLRSTPDCNTRHWTRQWRIIDSSMLPHTHDTVVSVADDIVVVVVVVVVVAVVDIIISGLDFDNEAVLMLF